MLRLTQTITSIAIMRLLRVHPVVAGDEQVRPSTQEKFMLFDELRWSRWKSKEDLSRHIIQGIELEVCRWMWILCGYPICCMPRSRTYAICGRQIVSLGLQRKKSWHFIDVIGNTTRISLKILQWNLTLSKNIPITDNGNAPKSRGQRIVEAILHNYPTLYRETGDALALKS